MPPCWPRSKPPVSPTPISSNADKPPMFAKLRLAASALAATLLVALPGHAFETRANAAWVYDLTTHTAFSVSENATAMTAQGGSTMYLQEGDRPTVDELIHGMIVNSGNDACVVVAEGLEGSEAEFAAKMTERAAALGLENSHFTNSSGWPDPGQRMSMKDLGLLSRRLIEEFPEYYPVFSETEFN